MFIIIIIIIKQEFSALSTGKNWADKALQEYTHITVQTLKHELKRENLSFRLKLVSVNKQSVKFRITVF